MDDGKGHFSQRLQFLVMVDAFQQIHLCDGSQTIALKYINEQTGFHAIAREKDRFFERLAPACIFSRKRLDDS